MAVATLAGSSSINPDEDLPLPATKRSLLVRLLFPCCINVVTEDLRQRTVSYRLGSSSDAASQVANPVLVSPGDPSTDATSANVKLCSWGYGIALRSIARGAMTAAAELYHPDQISKIVKGLEMLMVIATNTRNHMKVLSAQWETQAFETAGEFADHLFFMEECYKHYFEFFYGSNPEQVYYVRRDEKRLEFPYEQTRNRYETKGGLLGRALALLAPFKQLDLLVGSSAADGKAITRLAAHVASFCPYVEVHVKMIEGDISKMGEDELAQCKKGFCEHEENLLTPLRSFLEANNLKDVETLRGTIRRFRKCVGLDLEQVRVQYERYAPFATAFASPRGGFHLDCPNGLPTRWPIMITNPFGGETIVLSREELWEDCSAWDIEDVVESAVALGYVRVPYRGFFISPECWETHFEHFKDKFYNFEGAMKAKRIMGSPEEGFFMRASYWDRIRHSVTSLPDEQVDPVLTTHCLFPGDKQAFQVWTCKYARTNPECFQVLKPLIEYLRLRLAVQRYDALIEAYCFGPETVVIRRKLHELDSVVSSLKKPQTS